MTHETYKEMLVAQALNALDESEARALKAHLQDCADCRLEMDQWQENAAFLALSAETVEPSPKVWLRIQENIRAISAAGEEAKTSDIHRDDNRETTGNVIELRQPQIDRLGYQRWGAIAAAIAFVVMAIFLVVLWRQNTAAKRELALLRNQVHETEQNLERERQAIAILTRPGARMAELSATKMAPAAHAIVAYDKGGQAVLVARGLPPPPAGKAYQLWFISGGKPLPGKVFTTTAAGEGTITDRVPYQAMNAPVFAITLEPESGSQSPTSEIYLLSRS
jgi:anti-sigma-K factor RskA